MTFFNLIMLQMICVLIIDVLNAVDDMLSPLVRKITGSKVGKIGKPFNCSTCMTFWGGLIVLIAMKSFTLNWIAVTLLLAAFTPVMYLAISFFRDLATKAINELYDYFKI